MCVCLRMLVYVCVCVYGCACFVWLYMFMSVRVCPDISVYDCAWLSMFANPCLRLLILCV